VTTHPARAPFAPPAPDTGDGSVAVWVLGTLGLVVLAFIGLLLWLVVPTYTAPGPGEPGYGTVDPHGYVMILGTVLLVFATLVLACLAVPFGVLLTRIRRTRR
jgi:hypothetical protein